MLLNKKYSTVYILAATILIAVVFSFLLDNNELYGNDKESIVKIIKSIEGYGKESIEILEIKDIYNQRVVAFLYNNSPAYVEFLKNQKGNYEWRHIEKSEGQSFASHRIPSTNYEASTLNFMVITNEKNNIARLELGVNERKIKQKFSVNKKTVTWIEIPKSKSNSYSLDYKYYDKDNNLIGDY